MSPSYAETMESALATECQKLRTELAETKKTLAITCDRLSSKQSDCEKLTHENEVLARELVGAVASGEAKSHALAMLEGASRHICNEARVHGTVRHSTATTLEHALDEVRRTLHG